MKNKHLIHHVNPFVHLNAEERKNTIMYLLSLQLTEVISCIEITKKMIDLCKDCNMDTSELTNTYENYHKKLREISNNLV